MVVGWVGKGTERERERERERRERARVCVRLREREAEKQIAPSAAPNPPPPVVDALVGARHAGRVLGPEVQLAVLLEVLDGQLLAVEVHLGRGGGTAGLQQGWACQEMRTGGDRSATQRKPGGAAAPSLSTCKYTVEAVHASKNRQPTGSAPCSPCPGRPPRRTRACASAPRRRPPGPGGGGGLRLDG